MFDFGLERAVRTLYGWRLEWRDGRATRVEISRLELAPGGEFALHKVIRWAA